METPTQKPSYGDMLVRTIAVLGLIAVLLLGAWGIIQLAVAIPSFLSGIGGSVSSGVASLRQESVTLSVPATSGSGQTLTVAWTHTNKNGEYSYSLTYACQSGLSVKAPTPNGSYQTVACNTPFNFVNASEKMNIIPSGSNVPLALTVKATKLSDGSVTAQSTKTVTVSSTKAAAATGSTKTTSATTKGSVSTKDTTYTYYAAPTRPQLYGLGDLAIQILNVTPTSNGTVAVQFSVTNVGTNSVPGGWTFNANLPINGGYNYSSAVQRALFPGDKVVYTLTFSRPTTYYTYQTQYPYSYNTGYGYSAGSYMCNTYNCTNTYNQYPYNYPTYQGGTATITVDPYNMIYELSEVNNTATVSI